MKTRYDTYHGAIASWAAKRRGLDEARDRARPFSKPIRTRRRARPRCWSFHPDIRQAVTLLWGTRKEPVFERLWLVDGSGHSMRPEAIWSERVAGQCAQVAVDRHARCADGGDLRCVRTSRSRRQDSGDEGGVRAPMT